MPERKRYTYTPRRKKRGVSVMLVVFFGVFFTALTVAGILVVSVSRSLPDPLAISERKIPESTKIFDRTGKILLYEIHGEEKRTIIPFNQISQYVKDATIVAEDFNFYQHKGIDIKSLLRALYIDIVSGEFAQGGSTITQQLVKNAFLTRERTITRKIKEAILSYQLEKTYTKEEIFNYYLNQIPYGSNAYGTESAAQTFFAKKASDLTLNESATIAAVANAPSHYSPYGQHKDELIARKNMILERMRAVGFISAEDFEKAKNETLVFQKQRGNIKAPHFVIFIKNYLEEKYGAYYVESGGLNVYTTLDYNLQQIAEETVETVGEINKQKYNAKNAALVSVDPKTGELLAMVGSRDYFDIENEGNYNVATSRNRQPGSSFKPLVYATFFEKGFTPETVLFDVKTEFSTDPAQSYSPMNYDERFRGPVSVKSALAQSLNIPAVKVLYLAGMHDTLKLAHSMGISTLTDESTLGLSLVLGGGEAMPMDMAYAYGTFANDGVYNGKTFILKIEDNTGKVIEKSITKQTPALSPNTARTITSILSDNSLRAPVFGERSPLFFENKQIAAKTGTTQKYRDAWVVGYASSVATAVWVGNNDGTPISKGGGGIAAAGPLFHSFMEKATTLRPATPFPAPEPIYSVKSLLNGSYFGETIARIDTDSQKLATALTPPHKIQEKKFRSVHSILYYIDKNDPSGSPPNNPENDPQFQNWESAIQEWLRHNTSFVVPTEFAPTEYDDIHTEKNIPRITVSSPLPYTGISGTVYTRADVRAPFPVKGVDFYFDDALVFSDFQYPYETILDASTYNAGPHTLSVKTYDIYDNVGITNISLIK